MRRNLVNSPAMKNTSNRKQEASKPNVDHDRLFKNLITVLFVEFLELFAPQIAAAIDRDSIEFVDKEVFSELMPGKENRADILAKVTIPGEEGVVLVHIENQAKREADFTARMFDYFKKIDTKLNLPIYPIAVFSFNTPKRAEPYVYSRVTFGLEVIRYQFQPIQLNRLKWQDFVGNPNPIATALMAKMQVKPEDYVTVRRGFYELFMTGKLDRKQLRAIEEFMATYLKLTREQALQLEEEMETIMPPQALKEFTEIITERDEIAFEKGVEKGVERGIEQGIERGIEQGIEQGLREGEARSALRMTLRQADSKFGTTGEALRQRVTALPTEKLEELSIALLSFETAAELQKWLDANA